MIRATRKYPDTAEGALEAIMDISIYKHTHFLGIPRHLREGVWKVSVIFQNRMSSITVEMAGYKDEQGNTRLSNMINEN
jgi:hypothetical protein